MWLANNWKDYELLDCGRGEKLERWGDKILVRPDPQAIWNTPAHAAGVEGERRPLQPLQHRRRPLGQAQSAAALDRPLRRA